MALAQIDARTAVGVAGVEAAAELQATKLSAVGFVGRRALQEVAILSSAEQQLATTVPHASGRLATIADMTALAMTEVVVSSASRISRCG